MQSASASRAILAIVLALGALAAAERGNLLDDPGLDLGSESWILESWQSGSVPDRRSPSWRTDVFHSPPRCLLLPGGGPSLLSRRYPLVPGRTYVLSARLRLAAAAPAGEACRLFLLTPDWKIERTVVDAADLSVDDWRQVSLRYAASDRGGAYRSSGYIRLDARVDLLVDSLQLGEAPEPATWDPGPQIGITGLGPRWAAPPGEARLAVTANGMPGPATVRLTLRRPGGTGGWSTWIAAGSGVPVAVPLADLGVQEVVAELVVDGRVLASAARRILVEDGPATPHALLGIDCSPLQGSLAEVAWAAPLAAGLGVGFERTFFRTYNGDRAALPEDGDAFLAYAAVALDPGLRGDRPLMAVVSPAADSPLNYRLWRRQGRIPEAAMLAQAIPALAARCARIAAAMRGRLASLEVLNEPNIWIVDGRPGLTPELHARILAACAPAIRAAAPGMRVAANINGLDRAYVQALLAAGADIDELTVHAYRATPENPPLFEDLRRLRAVVDAHRPGLPIVNSEQYFLCRDAYAIHEFNRNYTADSEEDMAGRTVQAMLHHWAAEGTPYTLFNPAATLFRPIVPDEVRYTIAFGLVRAAGRLLAGCGRGETLPTHPACRAFLFRRGDGAGVATVTTRRFTAAGTMRIPPGAEAWDGDGNRLGSAEAAVGWRPLYLVFPAARDPAAIRAELAGAVFTGLDFPLRPSFAIDAAGHPRIAIANRGNRPASGTVEILAAPAGWPRERIAVAELAPGAAVERVLPATPPIARFAGGEVRWRAACAGAAVDGRERLPGLAIPRATAAPAIDGDLADWPAVAWTALRPSRDFAPERPRQGEDDCSARIALTWDPDLLYLAVAVRDGHSGPLPGPFALYTGDSVQLYLDPRLEARPDQRGYDSGNAVWSLGPDAAGRALAVLEQNPGDRYVGEANAETGLDPAIRVAFQRQAGGWMLEAAFPAAALGELELVPGSRCGLSLLVNDNDGGGRKQGATLGPAGSEPHQHPWIWPVAELLGP